MPGMKWIESIVFSKNSGNPIFGQILGHQRAENEARNTEMYRGLETHPIGVNARHEMNWANRKPYLQTAGWTDGRTDIWVNPVYPHSTFGGAGGGGGGGGGGYNECHWGVWRSLICQLCRLATKSRPAHLVVYSVLFWTLTPNKCTLNWFGWILFQIMVGNHHFKSFHGH